MELPGPQAANFVLPAPGMSGAERRPDSRAG